MPATSSNGRRGPYSKSDAVRARILDVGVATFGRLGYAATSTRLLAERAEVTLPAITYYFGGKEGLYRACAADVADRFIATTTDAARIARDMLAGRTEVAGIRTAFQNLAGSVVDAMLGASGASRNGVFAMRELLDPGPGFDIMFERLWKPGIELIARLIARLRGYDEVVEADLIDAQLLLASISAFQSGAGVATRIAPWNEIGPAQIAAVKARIAGQIERM